MAEAEIADAVVAPGHDGEAVLVVRVRHENGVVDSVTLDADAAERLLEECGVSTIEGLRGQPWHRLVHVLMPRGRRASPRGAAPGASAAPESQKDV